MISSLRTYIGIDPGVSGAIAFIRGDSVYIHDIPLLPKSGKWNMHDASKMYGLLVGMKNAIALIEHVRFDSRDGNHKGSAEVLVRSHEAWVTILKVLSIPTLDLEVPVWRKAAGCRGLTDAVSIVSKALQLYPVTAPHLKRRTNRSKAGYVYEHNRAEALLMAYACKTLSENSITDSYVAKGLLPAVND